MRGLEIFKFLICGELLRDSSIGEYFANSPVGKLPVDIVHLPESNFRGVKLPFVQIMKQ